MGKNSLNGNFRTRIVKRFLPKKQVNNDNKMDQKFEILN